MSHPSVRTLLIVYVLLMVLLAATYEAARLPTGQPWHVLIALAIAVVKMLLVILFFMHVRNSPALTQLVVGAGFLWLLILFVLTFSDYLGRGWAAFSTRI